MMNFSTHLNRFGTDVLAYIHNRWIDPQHHVVIRHQEFVKGTYYDPDTVLLFAAFQILVDYVELECGRDRYFETRCQRYLRVLYKLPVIGWWVRPARNARQGLHYLRWCMKLKDHPSQAHHAREVFRLYRWWKHERPVRIDPWQDYVLVRESREWKGSLTPKEKRLMERCRRREDRYEREDQRNLHALITIRKGLWI